ncbi:Maf family protein [Humidisolicoccus flavus]|uniref:Maf family protein n=1 Tax=Humidisolicoccus flavus TaxID=3111414 RepID=UPI003243D34F
MRVYLASTSPARLMVLRAAGIEPVVVPSQVDEDAVVRIAEQEHGKPLATTAIVQLLAQAKAEAILGQRPKGEPMSGIIIGGDSSLELDGETLGKPHTAERARARWQAQRGRTAILHSGHWVLHVKNGTVVGSRGATASARVTFVGDMSDAEIDAYVGTGEPLEVAGAFTIDSLGAAYIASIEGDPSTVIGVSVPTLRSLVTALGIEWPSLWNRPGLANANTGSQ